MKAGLKMAMPVRQMYLTLKGQFPDAILLLQADGFYEAFDRDARTIARLCNLVLTSLAISDGARVPLVTVPCHSIEQNLKKLIAAGYVVAIAEWDGNQKAKG